MTPRTMARLGAGAIVGLLNGFRDILDHRAGHAMGKAAFLASQGERFDRFYAGDYSPFRSLFVGLVISALVLSVYEAIAAGLLSARRPKKPLAGTQPH